MLNRSMLLVLITSVVALTSNNCFAPHSKPTPKRSKEFTTQGVQKAPHVCRICSREYGSPEELAVHSKHPHFTCTTCDTIIPGKRFYKIHQFAFHGGKLFPR